MYSSNDEFISLRLFLVASTSISPVSSLSRTIFCFFSICAYISSIADNSRSARTASSSEVSFNSSFARASCALRISSFIAFCCSSVKSFSFSKRFFRSSTSRSYCKLISVRRRSVSSCIKAIRLSSTCLSNSNVFAVCSSCKSCNSLFFCFSKLTIWSLIASRAFLVRSVSVLRRLRKSSIWRSYVTSIFLTLSCIKSSRASSAALSSSSSFSDAFFAISLILSANSLRATKISAFSASWSASICNGTTNSLSIVSIRSLTIFIASSTSSRIFLPSMGIVTSRSVLEFHSACFLVSIVRMSEYSRNCFLFFSRLL